MAHGGGGGGAESGGSMGGIVPKTGHGTAFVGMMLAAGLVWLTIKHPKQMGFIVLVSFPFACLTLGVPPQNSWLVWLPLLIGGIAIGGHGNHKHNMGANDRGRALVLQREAARRAEADRLNAIRNGRTSA